jgi:DNA gyrase subunit B
MNEKAKEYDSSAIKSLGIVGGVRARYQMYIDGSGTLGVLKCLHEMIANANDEGSMGFCNRIEITIETKKNTITVKDNGRGIPIGIKGVETIDQILLEMHSGGKFDRQGYEFSTGMNGCGLFLTNCLSTNMIVEVWRDKKHVIVKYKKGYRDGEAFIEKYDGKETGTSITFKPDIEILFGHDVNDVYEGKLIDKPTLLDILDTLSHINPGIRYDLTFDGHFSKFYFTGTVKDYLKELLHRNKRSSLCNSFYEFETKDINTNMTLKCIFTFVKDQSEEKYFSYMNQFPTIKGGTHVNACRKSISRAITNYIKSNNYIPKNAKFTATGNNVVDNIFGIVLGTMNNPTYNNQTKELLTSVSYEIWASSHIYSSFNSFASRNPEDMDKICKLAVLKARASFAAKEARELAMNPEKIKNIVNSNVNLKKFTDCSSSNPNERELYLCEGDSAGGTISQARNPKTQAFLRLRGKVLNVVTKNNRLSEELESIISVQGMGYGEKRDIRKLQFKNIVIACDADYDGGHIYSLLIGFYFVNYPEIIEEGRLFLAKPPYFQFILNKKHTLNVLNEDVYKLYKTEVSCKTFTMMDENEKVLPTDLFRVYLDKIFNYDVFLDNYATELNLDPILLELIVRNFPALIKGKYNQFKYFGFIPRLKNNTGNCMTIEFDRDFDHYYLMVDHSFYKNIYKPIYNRLSNIYLSNIKLKSKKTGKIYGGTCYHMSKVINSTLEGKNVEKRYLKGLGEMSVEDFRETCMDPKTRKLTQIQMSDREKTRYWINLLMGDEDMEKKKSLFMKQE